ncbi:hypothetical protein ASPFODRAFT_65994 [Aspergillus luchuensis CBS 106.47]|uniref:Uncharacterized protein n=1 Tax=Aspergillus luchuensis (strain CBS 106.47) TaxID=1137211 RepID=A0A1M3SZM3_ASPLC|nr:hypothetical protein ASPFODRAFT_65994 [Aspergillus luchuensis CBS 106.47]
MEHLKRVTSSTISYGQNIAQEHNTALHPVILGAIGFSASGPVAGSLAAAWQSSIGEVQAGTLFATLQGAAMGVAAANTFTAASNLGIGVAGLAAIRTHWTDMKRRLWVEYDGEDTDEAGNLIMLYTNDHLEFELVRLYNIDIS